MENLSITTIPPQEKKEPVTLKSLKEELSKSVRATIIIIALFIGYSMLMQLVISNHLEKKIEQTCTQR